MSRKIKRDSNGQFAPGASGNPEGARRRKPEELITIEDIHRIALKVAAEPAGMRSGKPVSRLENAFLSLAKGDSGSRLASRDMIELTKTAASYFDHQARSRGRRS